MLRLCSHTDLIDFIYFMAGRLVKCDSTNLSMDYVTIAFQPCGVFKRWLNWVTLHTTLVDISREDDTCNLGSTLFSMHNETGQAEILGLLVMMTSTISARTPECV